MENITILGVGRLGLGLTLLLEKAGYNILGVDISQSYIDALNSKTFTTKEPEYENLLQNAKNFKATLSIALNVARINHLEKLNLNFSNKSVFETGCGGIGDAFYVHIPYCFYPTKRYQYILSQPYHVVYQNPY